MAARAAVGHDADRLLQVSELRANAAPPKNVFDLPAAWRVSDRGRNGERSVRALE
jgi:hypothetical protein